ncbi:MAG: PIN domain-containing protein [Caldilineaceae bacterium]|nr:PIN domain-containing protein [Caldilineaceae bacterium]
MYLLDTNHCSRLLDDDPAVVTRLRQLDNALVSTCVIVRGELIFMVEKSDRRAENLQRVGAFLRAVNIYDIDSATADIYGRLKMALVAEFGPKDKTKRRKTRTHQLGVSENDLWIAAVAKRHGLIVVSADSDFLRIQQADTLQLESWLPAPGLDT